MGAWHAKWPAGRRLKRRRMRKRILVVEDDPLQREAISVFLREAGFEVDTVNDGEAAMSKARKEVPDLILLDVMLPGLNGFDVCETLRGDPATATVPIILMTGHLRYFGRYAGLESGADDFLFKPFDSKALVARVKNRLDRPPTVSKAAAAPNPKASAPAGVIQPSPCHDHTH